MKSSYAGFAFVIAGALSACSSIPRATPVHPTPADWGALLTRTDSLASAGRHAAADSMLLAFESAHAGSRAAAEVPFWRALYKLDPRNTSSAQAEGRALMDSYAASSSSGWYRAHANVLTHLARKVDVAEQGPGDTTIVAGDTSSAGLAARDRVIRNQRAEIARLNPEIARLSAEIARLSAELERIKRRLATPTP
ncbi:MAG: hypothetical protein ACR2GJ_03865 [Gemmatimonadaceae bacterium]